MNTIKALMSRLVSAVGSRLHPKASWVHGHVGGGRFWVTAEGAREIMAAEKPKLWNFAFTHPDGDPGYCYQVYSLVIIGLQEVGPVKNFPTRKYIIEGEIVYPGKGTRQFRGLAFPDDPLYPCGADNGREALCVRFYFVDMEPESVCGISAEISAELAGASCL